MVLKAQAFELFDFVNYDMRILYVNYVFSRSAYARYRCFGRRDRVRYIGIR